MECKVEPLGRGWFNAVATQPPSSQRGTSSSSTHSSTDRRRGSPGERQPQQWLVFEVADSGCGIGEAGLRSLFKDYVQVRTAGPSSCCAPAEPDHSSLEAGHGVFRTFLSVKSGSSAGALNYACLPPRVALLSSCNHGGMLCICLNCWGPATTVQFPKACSAA